MRLASGSFCDVYTVRCDPLGTPPPSPSCARLINEVLGHRLFFVLFVVGFSCSVEKNITPTPTIITRARALPGFRCASASGPAEVGAAAAAGIVGGVMVAAGTTAAVCDATSTLPVRAQTREGRRALATTIGGSSIISERCGLLYVLYLYPISLACNGIL